MSSLDLSRIENLQQASCLYQEGANQIFQDSQKTDREKKKDLATLQYRFVRDYRKAYPSMNVHVGDAGVLWGQRPAFQEGVTDPVRWEAHEQVWSAMEAVSHGNQKINLNFYWSVFSLVTVPWVVFFAMGDDIKVDFIQRANAATKRMLVGGIQPRSGLQFGVMLFRATVAIILPGLVAGSLYYWRHKDDKNAYPAVSVEGCGPKAS